MGALTHLRSPSRDQSPARTAQLFRALSSDSRPLLRRTPSCGFPSPAALSQRGTRIEIGSPDSVAEQEADALADRVMSGSTVSSVIASSTPRLDRKRANFQKLDEASVTPLTDNTAHPRSGSAGYEKAPQTVEATLREPGRPLDEETRAFFEPRFGWDFAHVRVHSDPLAQRSAQDVGAHAYAVGQDIAFGPGQFAPGTSQGRRLLAHELAHVVQQGDSTHSGCRDAPPCLRRYRSPGKETIAFEGADETLKDPKSQPWIESISVDFDKVAPDKGHEADAKSAGQLPPRMPVGKLTAKYSPKSSSVPADIVLSIAGGSTMLGIGLTDRVSSAKVLRLEGLGYMDSENIRLGNLKDPVATKGKGARYSKSGAGSMNYAIFFKGIQAIHQGALDTGSHACVHVDSGPSIRTLNHHTRIGVTTVSVSYNSKVLDDLCCHRKATGNANWSANPCEKTKCP